MVENQTCFDQPMVEIQTRKDTMAKNQRRGHILDAYNVTYGKEVNLDKMQEAMRHAFYTNIDPRRRQEMSDGGIVREDDSAMANLPRQAIHHEYPREGYYSSAVLDQNEYGKE
jgi:hypothetical protein